MKEPLSEDDSISMRKMGNKNEPNLNPIEFLEPSRRATRRTASGRSSKAAFRLSSLKMLYYYCCDFLLEIGDG